MDPKSQLNHSKSLLIMGQIGVLALCMAAIFWLMVSSNKERIENDLRTRLDASTQAMAAQLKADQVPFSGASVEPGVLIINQTDGSVVVDRRNGGDAEQKLWEGYKTKIIYEMQKQKRGWIEYPDKSTWNLNEPQRIIRYISIDELNWILAVEDLKPSFLDLIKESVNPSACFLIFFIFILGAGVLWLLTMQYFDQVKRQISNSLEDNLLSLSGEEKLWSHSRGQIPKVNEGGKESGLEFSTPKSAAPAPPDVETMGPLDPIMQEVFHQPSAGKPISPVENNIASATKEKPREKLKEKPKEIPKEPSGSTVENNDMAVDVQHINSPVLKKMLQQFRKK